MVRVQLIKKPAWASVTRYEYVVVKISKEGLSFNLEVCDQQAHSPVENIPKIQEGFGFQKPFYKQVGQGSHSGG
jgi:hypothetical protein